MTKLEEFRTNSTHIKAWNDMLETGTGKLFMEVLNEGVLSTIRPAADDTEHATIFRSGRTSGASYLYQLAQSLHAQEIAEEERKRAEQTVRGSRNLLPSQVAAMKARIESHGNPTK